MRRGLLIASLLLTGCEAIIDGNFGARHLASGGSGGASSSAEGGATPTGSGAGSQQGGAGASGPGGSGGSGPTCSPPCAWTCLPGNVCDEPLQITAGSTHACALSMSGRIACWGANDHGQLGDGTTMDRDQPVEVPGIDDATQIAAGVESTCAVRKGNGVVCWGSNVGGQLGDGKSSHQDCGGDDCSPNYVDVKTLTNAKSVTCGAAFACALTTDSQVWCWGAGTDGQLGDGLGADTTKPMNPVSNLSDAAEVVTYAGGACARTSMGSVSCWGLNTYGQLGDGPTTHVMCGIQDCALQPVTSSLAGVSSVVATSVSVCGISSGGVSCWGFGGFGQLGNGSSSNSSSPVQATDLTDADAIAGALFGGHPGLGQYCAHQSGKVLCWGADIAGQLGAPALDESCPGGPYGNHPCSDVPTKADAPSDVASLALGGQFSCALLTSNAIVCWGDNSSGQLGHGTVDAGGQTPVTVLPPR